MSMSDRGVAGYLDSFINYERSPVEDYARAFKLQRMELLLASLGNPQKGLKAVHVAGTKGKGSTAAFIASILQRAGLRAGLYTSPHLVSFRERIAVNGAIIEEEALSRVVLSARPEFERLRERGISFFEVYTAIAFLYFREKSVDVAVMETGMGGRLDATNTSESSVSVITPISLEHTRVLGDTVGRIAGEKAGIIKRGVPCVCSPQEDDALSVIEDACAAMGSKMALVGRDITVEEIGTGGEKEVFTVRTPLKEYKRLETGMLGRHQVVNAAAAIGAAEALSGSGIVVSEQAVRDGIDRMMWPGRMEIAGRRPLIVLDGAQNTASAKALLEAVKRCFGRDYYTLILGISSDKDIKGVCDILSKGAREAFITRADNPRAADPFAVKEHISGCKTEVIARSRDALSSALARSGRDDLILVTGSLFLVGEIREALRRE